MHVRKDAVIYPETFLEGDTAMRKKYVIGILSVVLLIGAYSGLWVASVSDGYVRLWWFALSVVIGSIGGIFSVWSDSLRR